MAMPSLHQLLMNAITGTDMEEPSGSDHYFSVVPAGPIIPENARLAPILDINKLSNNSSKLSSNLLPLEFNAHSDADNTMGTTWLALVVLLVGMALNGGVLWRMRRTKRRPDKEQSTTSHGIGACLRAMAFTDLAALCALAVLLAMAQVPDADEAEDTPDRRITLRDAACKASALVAHASFSLSMWCWLFMSGARFLATRRPLQYFALWRVPHMALGAMAAGSVALQAWLLRDVAWQPRGAGCVLEATTASRVQAGLDVVVSFAVPLLLLLHMDIRVLWCRRKKQHADPMLQIVINRPNGERKRHFHRHMLVVFTSVALNVPGNGWRLLAALGAVRADALAPALAWLFNILHIAQFTFNALYLLSFVQERSQFSKSNSSRQLSISIRQRLEDGGGHFIRERASTISYRTSSPTPGLCAARIKGANSCCAIDFLCPPTGGNGNGQSWV